MGAGSVCHHGAAGSGPENRLHDICLQLRERAQEPQKGNGPEDREWELAPCAITGPLGSDPRTARMTSVCN